MAQLGSNFGLNHVSTLIGWIDAKVNAARRVLKANLVPNNPLYRWLRGPSMWWRHLVPRLIARYRSRSASGIFFREDEMGMCSLLPEGILIATFEHIKPLTVLDVGCGTGQTLGWFLERGCEAIGIEASDLAIKKSGMRSRIRRLDLRKPVDLQREFDLVWSFEVAEHLPEDAADNFVATLIRHSNCVVMSAAPPGQGGEGHLNEQPSQYWINKFEARGWSYEDELTTILRETNDMFAQNMMVFRRVACQNNECQG